METKQIVLDCPKEVTEIGEALGAVLEAMGSALADGFQPGLDIPVIVTAAIAKLGGAIEGAGELPVEFKEDPTMFVMGALVPVAKGIKEVVSLRK